MPVKYPSIITGICLSGLFVLGWLVYYPGLSGQFLLDDYANLPALGAYGPIDNWENLQLYLSGGIAGPTGRPLALLSFLIDAHNWPANPFPFKRTNILLHLVNGCLLFWLATQLLMHYHQEAIPGKRTVIAATAATALWLLNPYLVSTTLYVVQRMTELSALFVILGLAGYVHGRILFKDRPRRGYLWMSLSLSGGTLLAVLSKENGILLPLLALVIDFSLFNKRVYQGQPNTIWKWLFLRLPALLPFAYFTVHWHGILAGYHGRGFDLYQRLLTESRILWDYLYQLFIPHLHTRGLFHDSYPLSTGLLAPATTILSLAGLAILLTGALALRKRYPLVTLSLLVFFAGHVLESTVIPLELYFEHRNYLPSILLFLPIADWLARQQYSQRGLIGISVLVMLFSLFTWQRSTLWGNQTQLLLTWAMANPDSTRAQTSATDELSRLGAYHIAKSNLDQAIAREPENITLQLRRLLLNINHHRFSQQEFSGLLRLGQSKPYEFRAFQLLKQIALTAKNGANKSFGSHQALTLLQALEKNPKAGDGTGPDHLLQHLIGIELLSEGKVSLALAAFQRSLKSRPSADAGMQQVAILATAGADKQALVLLDEVALILRRHKDHRLSAKKIAFLKSEIQRIRQEIIKDQKKYSNIKKKPTIND